VLRLVVALRTALFAVDLDTVPFFGAECTLRTATDRLANVLAADDLALVLDDVLRVFAALLACALVGTFLLGIYKPLHTTF